MKFAIPSYRRSDQIASKTLATLKANGINPSDVDIFLSDEDDLKAYRSTLGDNYNLIFEKPLNGVVEKFNFIHYYYPIGEKVVFIEDDIECLKHKIGENKLDAYKSLEYMANDLFKVCESRKTKLWGISSNANPFYMKPGVAVGFKFIVANLFGFISTKDPFLAISHHCKSDYERTILYFVKFGSVVRQDDVCAVTKNYVNSGGIQSDDNRAALEQKACHALVKRFPHLVSINEKKSQISKYMELKLKTLNIKKSSIDYYSHQQILDKRNSPS